VETRRNTSAIRIFAFFAALKFAPRDRDSRDALIANRVLRPLTRTSRIRVSCNFICHHLDQGLDVGLGSRDRHGPPPRRRILIRVRVSFRDGSFQGFRLTSCGKTVMTEKKRQDCKTFPTTMITRFWKKYMFAAGVYLGTGRKSTTPSRMSQKIFTMKSTMVTSGNTRYGSDTGQCNMSKSLKTCSVFIFIYEIVT